MRNLAFVPAFVLLVFFAQNAMASSNIPAEDNPALTVMVEPAKGALEAVECKLTSKVSGVTQIYVIEGTTGKMVYSSKIRLTEGENKVSLDANLFKKGTIYKVIVDNKGAKVKATTTFRRK